MPWPRTPRASGDLSQVNIHPHSASTKKPNQISELVRPVFRLNRITCKQWWETLFPNSATISCSSNDYASVDVECSNADVVDVGHTGEREVLGSNEREVLGMLACSRRVQEPVHSKVPEQVQVHSKLVLVQEPVHSRVLVQEQVHSMELVQEQVHSMELVREQVHSMELVREPVHNKELVLEQVHSMELVRAPVHNKVLEQVRVHSMELVQVRVHSMELVREQVHSKGLVLGKLACSIAGASDD